jgi:hypothetical protein
MNSDIGYSGYIGDVGTWGYGDMGIWGYGDVRHFRLPGSSLQDSGLCVARLPARVMTASALHIPALRLSLHPFQILASRLQDLASLPPPPTSCIMTPGFRSGSGSPSGTLTPDFPVGGSSLQGPRSPGPWVVGPRSIGLSVYRSIGPLVHSSPGRWPPGLLGHAVGRTGPAGRASFLDHSRLGIESEQLPRRHSDGIWPKSG